MMWTSEPPDYRLAAEEGVLGQSDPRPEFSFGLSRFYFSFTFSSGRPWGISPMPFEPPRLRFRQQARTFIRFVEIHDQVLKLIRRTRDVLEQPVPDTFLGRKTQEPLPEQE